LPIRLENHLLDGKEFDRGGKICGKEKKGDSHLLEREKKKYSKSTGGYGTSQT